MRKGRNTAALGCLLLLLFIVSGCAAGSPKGPKGIYRAFYGIEPQENELATLDMGPAHEMIIDDKYYVSGAKYSTVKLPAGTHRIRLATESRFEPSGLASFGIPSQASLEAGHTYKYCAKWADGNYKRVYLWIEDMTTGRIVQGEKKP